MQMRAIAVLIGDELYNAQGHRVDEPVRAIVPHVVVERFEVTVPPALDTVEDIVAQLARIIKAAQHLDDADRSRVREFVEAARSTLLATTRLDRSDQQIFQTALHNAARQG
jgi:hypothetical protein